MGGDTSVSALWRPAAGALPLELGEQGATVRPELAPYLRDRVERPDRGADVDLVTGLPGSLACGSRTTARVRGLPGVSTLERAGVHREPPLQGSGYALASGGRAAEPRRRI